MEFCVMIAIIQSRNFSSSYLQSKNIKIEVCKIVTLPVVLYECETWSLTLWEEQRVFENTLINVYQSTLVTLSNKTTM
jgi:hypothetical protein